MEIDISKWHPIGWKQDFFGRPLQESVTGEIVTIDELMARYNFLLGAAQHGVQSDVPPSAGQSSIEQLASTDVARG